MEEYKEGKAGEKECEDELFLSKHFVAVIDGVTSKSDFRYQGKTTGKLAAETIRFVFEGLKGGENFREVENRINQAYDQIYQKISFPYSCREKCLQAAAVIYSANAREIWMVGDCQAAVDGQIYENPKKSDLILSQMRSLILRSLEMAGEITQEEILAGKDPGREAILPWILKTTIYGNNVENEYGYSVFNGERIPDRLVQVIKLDENCHEVILASDGYPKLKATLEKSEDALGKILKADPGCYKLYLSTKGVIKGNSSFDDRTYIRFLTD